MPAAKTDVRLLLGAGGAAIAAGLVVAAVLLFATGRSNNVPRTPKPLYIGQESTVRSSLKDGGPSYYADPFGGAGFWTALDHEQVVAVAARLPSSPQCHVRWRASMNSFVDCRDHKVGLDHLSRYRLTFPKVGTQKGGVLVNVRDLEPAPAQGAPPAAPATTG